MNSTATRTFKGSLDCELTLKAGSYIRCEMPWHLFPEAPRYKKPSCNVQIYIYISIHRLYKSQWPACVFEDPSHGLEIALLGCTSKSLQIHRLFMRHNLSSRGHVSTRRQLQAANIKGIKTKHLEKCSLNPRCSTAKVYPRSALSLRALGLGLSSSNFSAAFRRSFLGFQHLPVDHNGSA